tara:strand:- start:14 stop:484 length:471 start_codon:yes stop_codon:yes gene_type:complete
MITGFGKLYCSGDEISGEWIEKVAKTVSNLRYSFEECSKELYNGINIYHADDEGGSSDTLGMIISSFIINSKIKKNMTKYSDEGDVVEYTPIVNIFLESINDNSTSIINKEAIESIIIILNHPHFSGCKSIEDIEKKIPSVNSFNSRYEDSDSDDY